MSLVVYQEMKQKWGREEYIELCSRNERNGWAWMKAEVWKLRGIRRGWDKGTCPLCRGNEMLSIYRWAAQKPKTWRMQFVNKKLLCINKKLAYKKIVNCTNKAHMIHSGEYLDKVKHK
jgi:hypothetical protein